LYPDLADVKAIAAAATAPLRQELALRLQAAGFEAAQLVEDPQALHEALAQEARSWVVTAGPSNLVRPFVRTALQARVPVLALIEGDPAALRGMLQGGAAAVLDLRASAEAIRASSAAIHAGLVVWQPSGELDPSPGAKPAPLSPREREVLAGVAAGLSNKLIGRQLALSPNTVKFHLQEAFDKLGVASRAEAVAVAMRRGELSI